MLTPVVVYTLGVAIGLWRVDAAPVTRVVVALLWPLGLVAAIVTITGLALASLVLFPTVGAITAVVVAVIWYLAR